MTLTAALSGLLVGTSGFALYAIPPKDNPYAWTACAFGVCHGVLGLINHFKSEGEEGSDCCGEVSEAIMEIVPLPLVNIELYLNSASNQLALGHGLFVIPLVFDLIAKKYLDEGDESNTETLKDLTILGNIVSLVFLAVNEDNYLYGGMALTAFFTKYGAKLVEHLSEGNGAHCTLLGHTIFYYLTAIAVAGASIID